MPAPPIYALAVFQNNLVIGGNLTYAVLWDGSAFAGTVKNRLNGIVRTLASFNGLLYAGGDFTTMDSFPDPYTVNYFVSWNGNSFNTWIAYVTGVYTGVDGSVYAMTTYDGNLWLGGAFSSGWATYGNHVIGWTGSEFLTSAISQPVVALHAYEGSIMAGGYFTVHVGTMTGYTSWSALGGGADGIVWSFADGTVGTSGSAKRMPGLVALAALLLLVLLVV